ncbi:MAG: zinc dependent phospholipase C family protein [Sphingobacteriaceae bacterium]
MAIKTKIAVTAALWAIVFICSSWGFFAHQKINRLAVFTLPKGMIWFYKNHINFITEHAVDPDKRRYADSLEAPRHFLDADRYGDYPFEVLPEKWKDAVAKFGEDSLEANGTVPWVIERNYYLLVKAFKERDSLKILHFSADLGHYIGDAHVPLHTTENYNGQMTGQTGIHGFWESRLPELFSSQYDFLVGRAQYIENPLKKAWEIVSNTYTYKDSVLLIEARLNAQFPSDRKYGFSQRNGQVIRQYAEDYAKAYHEALNGMVERQMRAAILNIGSYWYSAWVDAGQPDLKKLNSKALSTKEKQKLEEEEQLYRKGKMKGRPETD